MAKKKISGVKKIGDRNYSVDAVVLVNERRVHIRGTGYSSAQEAKDAMPELLDRRVRRLFPKSTDLRFPELVERFYDWRSAKLKPQSLMRLRYLVEKHISPHFGNMFASDALSYQSVASWYRAKCGERALSQTRKNDVFMEMRQIIDRAWRWHCISSDTHQDLMDLVQNIAVAKKPKEEKAVWTYEQETKFLESIPKDNIDYPMLSLFCYLGCRIGEFLGLQWKCFDQENRTITICQQVLYMNGGAILTPELKTDESYRVNYLDDETFEVLCRYRATLNSSKGDEFIFPSPRNAKTPLSRTEFRRRFAKWVDVAKLPRIVLHGVRHSKATMLASVCENAEEVAVGAKFLGHSSSMFMDTYVSKNGVEQADLIARMKGSRK